MKADWLNIITTKVWIINKIIVAVANYENTDYREK